MSINLSVDSHQVLDAIDRLLERVENPKPAFWEIAGYLERRHLERFNQEVDPDGNPWEELAPATKKQKNKGYYVDGVLVPLRSPDRTLLGLQWNLQDQIVTDADTYSAMFGIGNDSEQYAPTHHFGDPRRNIPARPLLGIGDEDEAEVLAILTQFIETPL